MNRREWADILSGRVRGPRAGILRTALLAGVPLYGGAVLLRNALFDTGLRRPAKLGRPVVSVGNLTAGGTGKTPMVVALAQRLMALGARPAVLLRGYTYRGAPLMDSDEARLLRSELGPQVPVEPNPSRVEGARRVLGAHPEVSVFVLDDGFQHRQAHRDLNLVLIDATEPFGGGRLLPAGLMREPLRALKRADAIILSRADLAPPETLDQINALLRRRAAAVPIVQAAAQWNGWREATGAALGMDVLRDTPVAGVCGVGNPHQFAAMLGAACSQVTTILPLNDHQVYGAELLESIFERARQRGAAAVVTTEKDWVKWQVTLAQSAVKHALPVYRPILDMRFLRGAAEVDALLRNVISHPTVTNPSGHVSPRAGQDE